MTRTRVLAVIAALTLVAAACGGDDDAGTTTTKAAAETTATKAAAETATTAPATTTTTADVADDAAALAEVRSALERSQTATSGRFDGLLTMVGVAGAPPDVEVTVPFAGEFDTTAKVSSFSMDMRGFAEAAGEDIPPGFDELLSGMEVLTFDDVAYLRFPFFTTLFGIATPNGSSSPPTMRARPPVPSEPRRRTARTPCCPCSSAPTR